MSETEPNPHLPRNPTKIRRRAPRKVSALTAQQAQHKRDLDRKAQRALRQRVKSRLQDLEDDLARAKADCSIRDQKLMEEVQRLREENRKLRSYLDSIGQFALNWAGEAENTTPVDNAASPDPVALGDEEEPALEHDDQHEPIYGLPQQEHPMAADTHGTPTQRNGGRAYDEHGDRTQPAWVRAAQDRHGYTRAQPGPSVTPTAYQGATNISPGQLHLPPPGTEAPLSRGQTRQYLDFHGQRDGHIQADSASQGLQQPTVASSHSVLGASWAPPLNPTVYQPSLSTGISSVLPKHTPATCPLDQILLDFIDSQRSLVAKGYEMESIFGPLQPSLQAVLHPAPPNPGVHAASRVLGEVLITFPHVAVPEKMALMFVMYRTMRWQISPTDANYEQMPRWLRPTATQITVPHAAWIDNIPWPRVRDLLIEHPEKYPFAVFSEMFSQNVTVNWPYEDMDSVSTRAENVEFNPIFEKHVRKLASWTVLESFKDYLPEMLPAIYGRE